MLRPLVLLIAFQFAGEAVARLGGLPVPGPVLGLALLALSALLVPALYAEVEPTADLVLRHLSLLFVPAGVGMVQHLGLLRRELWPILGVLLLSTAVTLAVTALTFQILARQPLARGRGDARSPEEAP